jgi:predicted small integral membrane protein
MFGWMMWTWQSALFFIFVFGAIGFISIFAAVRPSAGRKGFLPIATTGGDRLFIGLITGIIILLLWMTFVNKSELWMGAAIATAWFVVEAIWG